ncbi:MAG TPA: phosphoglucosamine mutase [Gemmatimonadales bacterium]|jgi:phosphomannomutase|nr:phosphoglucosamine mutase [Gemmatimonadales bacterium]
MSDTLMISVSGIRGLVGKDLTPEMVARWAAAFGVWSRERGAGGRKRVAVVLGRDARTSGPMFAQAATAGLNSVGCDVIDVGLVATPTVQLAVEHHRAAGGIILTASHNPIEWNALKFVGPDGIFLDTVAGTRLRELAAGEALPRANYNAIGGVEADSDAIARHLAAVLALKTVDVRTIRRRRFRVALDTVRGAGGAVMPELLERLGCRVTAINLETDGLFPRPPEPVPENLKALGALVRRTKADIGIAVDPDVDRLAIVDEKGRPIGEDYTLAFAVRAVLGRADGRMGRRAVVCNLSTSLVVEDAAKEFGAKIVRAPVGEAHVARTIIGLNAVIGGEGNGGVMYPALHVGRDAPVGAALILSLLARERVTVSAVVARAPRYTIVKAKQELGGGSREPGKFEAIYVELRRRFPEAAADTQDGLRLAWSDRWLHVRPSGTEPIIRLIAEAPTGADAERLIDEGRRLCAAS